MHTIRSSVPSPLQITPVELPSTSDIASSGLNVQPSCSWSRMGSKRQVLRQETDRHIATAIIIPWQAGLVALPLHCCLHRSDKRQFQCEWEDEWSWDFAASRVILGQSSLQDPN